jgi:ATP-binding cassette subfamily F protein 3
MLSLQNITLYAGSLCLLHEASLTVHPGQKIGLIGQNGAGKSTLFKAILGEMPLDGGEIKMPPNWQIGHVAQEITEVHARALDYVLLGDTLYAQLRQKITQAELAEDHPSLVTLYDEMDLIQGYQVPIKAKQLLYGLGFSEKDFQKPLSEFSGGWQVRLKLAQALMQRADLLLLDEPTNHLDIEAVSWLSNWLSQYEGALLVISHDRQFLDEVVGGIALLSDQKIHYYSGNFAAYERQRNAQLMQQQAMHDKQKQQMQHLKSFIDRFKAKASKAKQAQSRVKALERMNAVAAVQAVNPFHFEFPSPDYLPDPMIQVESVSFAYDDRPILKEVDVVLRAGDRIGLVGVNGSGKTTFLKVLIGELAPQAGKVRISKGVKVGYFAQHQLESLNLEQTPVQHFLKLSNEVTDQIARNFLGKFGFSNEKATSPVKHFSGGEKARLSLAMIVYQQPNLIILDEPTNHLDMETRDALEVALLEFSGAIIVVSHDRHLLTSIVDRFWWVHDQNIEPFEGGLDAYLSKQLEWVKKQAQNDRIPSPASVNNVNKRVQRQQSAQSRQALQKTLRPLTRKLEKVERALSETQKALSKIHQRMQETEFYESTPADELTELLKHQADLESQVEGLEEQWIELEEEIERIKSEAV